MKDVFDRELMVGDLVAYPSLGYTYQFFKGKIIGFTEKKVIIQPEESPEIPVKKFPHQVIKKS